MTTKTETRRSADGYQPKNDYIHVPYMQPHWTRRKEIIKQHPEIKQLQKLEPWTAGFVVLCVALMTFLAFLCSQASFLATFALAYLVGAFVLHAQWVLIHELTHDLVFKHGWLNTTFLILCNLPHVLPSAVSFRYFHRMHHGHLNEAYADPDVPSIMEDKIFGHSALGKATWLSFFSILQALRTLRSPQPFEWPLFLNVVANASYSLMILYYFGPMSLFFLLLSSLLGVGFLLHPLGGRWLAEHFAVHPAQETYSYYGLLNLVSFNIGYHNEHHDFINIPWLHLPKLKVLAPEYYETLHQHPSYLRVIYEFLFNPDFTLRTRVVRTPRNAHLKDDTIKAE